MIRSIRRVAQRSISFSWEDPLNLESLLTEEEKLIRDSARHFAQQKLKPKILQDFRTESGERDIIKLLGEQGYFHDEPIGNVAYGLINKELDAVDSGYRTSLSVQNGLVLFPLRSYAKNSIKEKYVPKLESGDYVGCFCLTEANHGSNPEAMETRAQKKGSKYVLNGSKIWISNSPIADVFVVWAKDQTGDVIGFALEKDTPGLSVTKIQGKLSLRASSTGIVSFHDVELDEENMLQVRGMKGPLSCLGEARFGIAWSSFGAAEACYKIARNYTLERKQFGRPLAQTQLIQKKLADMATEISLGLLAAYHVSKLKDEGKITPQMVSILKRNACQKSLQIAREARDMLGGNGIVDEYDVLRHAMNLEAVNTYEGTADIHSLIIGKGITGLQAFS
ncbi:unnamed protein product [Blepharisma stoltei]|uniref:glutaryl-CoA dehydrogenase (ETF) n=1 Tax=Blepharisma stoltei TaxID=1481888 RepID=A0AAU9IIQ2_9CILI|nr:unnamed protein product [Blepharisma stoltei]